MSEEWKELASASLEIVKDSLKGFVERQEVQDFAKEKTELFAKEWWESTHAATEDEHVDQRKQVVDDADLVRDLGATEDRRERPLGVLEQLGEHLDLALHQEPGVGRQ